MRALVTGAGGFVGRALVTTLKNAGWQVRASSSQPSPADVERAPAIDVAATNDALAALCHDCDVVFHLAAFAHGAGQDDVALNAVNVDLPGRLYRAALAAGVTRFVFVSSAKVLGNTAAKLLPVDAPRAPAERYARSKATAEAALEALAEPSTALLIVRPPLVYGPGVGANFARLLHWVTGPWPLPFGAATAPRSFVSRQNLAAALRACASAPAGIYHVADAEAWTLSTLLRALYAAQDRTAKLWRVPLALLATALRLVGQGEQVERLLAPLALDCDDSFERLQWQPQPAEKALKETVQWFLNQR